MCFKLRRKITSHIFKIRRGNIISINFKRLERGRKCWDGYAMYINHISDRPEMRSHFGNPASSANPFAVCSKAPFTV